MHIQLPVLNNIVESVNYNLFHSQIIGRKTIEKSRIVFKIQKHNNNKQKNEGLVDSVGYSKKKTKNN